MALSFQWFSATATGFDPSTMFTLCCALTSSLLLTSGPCKSWVETYFATSSPVDKGSCEDEDRQLGLLCSYSELGGSSVGTTSFASSALWAFLLTLHTLLKLNEFLQYDSRAGWTTFPKHEPRSVLGILLRVAMSWLQAAI